MVVLVFSCYFGFWAWFGPEKFPAKIDQYRKKFNFLNYFPNFIIEIMSSIEKSTAYLWWVRIGSVLFILVGILFMYVLIFGPL